MRNIIIIPARMASTRFPNKPMALIDGIPMVQRVWQQAIKSNIGEVVVGCSEKEVLDLISDVGGNAVMTSPELPSGTDRVFEVLKNHKDGDLFEYIINLQGDMPIINPLDITKVIKVLSQGFEIGTLVTNLSNDEEKNINITKAKINWIKKEFLGEAIDFYKISKNKFKNVYHHVGIYGFRIKSLKKFVELKQSQNEIFHNLEQLRALDAKMSIGVSFVNGVPLSVDTKDDLIKVENIVKGIK